jgi:hypothetical protein
MVPTQIPPFRAAETAMTASLESPLLLETWSTLGSRN